MTAEQFVALYKGRRVRVNGNATRPENIGREGIIIRTAGLNKRLVAVDMDDGRLGVFLSKKLDLLDDPKRLDPLPLPE